MEKKTFFELMRDYEKDASEKNLQALATAVANSVVKKVLDPQRKDAQKPDRNGMPRKSDSGFNPAILSLQRDIRRDVVNVEKVREYANYAYHATCKKDGTPFTETVNKDAEKGLQEKLQVTIGDGYDLVQTAALAILEEKAAHGNSERWLEKPYEKRKLEKRVLIQSEDSAAWKTVETTPIQEIFQETRRIIEKGRTVQIDPRNGYCYLADIVSNDIGDVENVYYRIGKFVDLGGTPASGYCSVSMPDLYSADRETVLEYNSMLEKLNLTARQMTIVKMRMQGYGYKAIGTALGVRADNVKVQIKRIREKCEKLGFTPEKTSAQYADDIAELVRGCFDD